MNPENADPVAAKGGTSIPDPDPLSDQIKQVRSAARSLLEKVEKSSSVSDLATAVDKASGALKLGAPRSMANRRGRRRQICLRTVQTQASSQPSLAPHSRP